MDTMCQRSSAKSHLLSRMSHELKTPMNAILGLSDLALDCDSLDEIKDYLRKLHNSGEHLLYSINNTLDVLDKEALLYEENTEKTEYDEGKKRNLENLKGKEILLCEDHPMNIFVEEKLLNKVGCHVTVAKNGLEGVETFDQSAEGFFDAIIMDIRMPIMDGMEASQMIRKLKRKDSKRVPIIALTANAYDTDEKKTAKAGMNGFLTKPVVPKLMYSTLASKIKG